MATNSISKKLAVVALLGFWGPASFLIAGEAEQQDRLKVSAGVEGEAIFYVGKAVPLKVILKNTTAEPLAILDWDRFPRMIYVNLNINDYPGYKGGGPGFRSGGVGAGRIFFQDEFRMLPPGPTFLDRQVIPMLPGKVRVEVVVQPPTDKYGGRSDRQQWKNGVEGRFVGQTTVTVLAEISAEMKTRYEEHRAEIERPTVPVEKKLEILAEVAGEKHYFAARFIRETYDVAEPGRVKEAALRHLLDLAKFGTAYESFPLLVKVMEQENAPQDIRLTLLGWIGEVLARQGYQRLAEQAFHRYPEPLQEEARQTIQRLGQDRNPFVAARAREVLKALEPEK